MRIGLPGGGATVDRLIDNAVQAEADGFTTLVRRRRRHRPADRPAAGRPGDRPHRARHVDRPDLPRHPVLMAQQAAAVALAIGTPGRFTLGVGVSHRPVIEGMYGLRYDGNARHLREYLTVLCGLLKTAGCSSRRRLPGRRRGGPAARPGHAGAGGRAAAVAGRCGRAGRRHHHVDGERARGRDVDRPHAAGGGGRGGPARAPGGRRAARGRDRRPRRRAGGRGPPVRPLRHPCPTTSGCWRRVACRRRPRPPSWETRTRWARPSPPCSTPGPPTCGPHRSRWGRPPRLP